jgi:SAM-dependent methyltransferase
VTSATARRPPEYRRRNRAAWESDAVGYELRHRRSLEREGGRAWGVWRLPERTLRLLDPVRGRDVLELGCGAAAWSIALAQDGARVVGLDFSRARLAQARENMRAAGVDFPLLEAPAEAIPLPDASFDLVLSDYGATTFTDPRRTIPEVARVLRPGGSFVFAHASPFRTVAENGRTDRMERRLMRPYFHLAAIGPGPTVEFQLPYGEWIELFRASGLEVERLLEPPAPRRGSSTYVAPQGRRWARSWPFEAIWKVRKSDPGRSPSGPGYRPGRRGARRRPGRSAASARSRSAARSGR